MLGHYHWEYFSAVTGWVFFLFLCKVAGWLLIAVVVITVFLSYCLASCFSPLSFLHFRYWSSYVHNEQQLFDEATDQHSRLYAMQHVKKFFGFVPGSENVKEIRIPSLREWQAISGLAFLKRVDEEHYDYSLLHDWALRESENRKYLKIDEDPVIRTQLWGSKPPPTLCTKAGTCLAPHQTWAAGIFWCLMTLMCKVCKQVYLVNVVF